MTRIAQGKTTVHAQRAPLPPRALECRVGDPLSHAAHAEQRCACICHLRVKPA